jgi:hypothetical protein
MSLDITIQLKDGKTLRDCALEVQALNAYVGMMGINPATGEDWFPRPIACNPDSESQEGFLGSVNTPPDEQNYVQVRIDNYLYINWGKLPAAPTTFVVVSGKPESTAVFA